MTEPSQPGDRISYRAEGTVIHIEEPNSMNAERGWLIVEDDDGCSGGMFLDDGDIRLVQAAPVER